MAVESAQDLHRNDTWLSQYRWLLHVPDLDGDLRRLQRLVALALEYSAEGDDVVEELTAAIRRVAGRHASVLESLRPEQRATQSDIFLG